MKKEELIKLIPAMEELYLIISNFTGAPFVATDQESFLDFVYYFTKEEDANAFAKKLEEEKNSVRVVKLDSKEVILQGFSSLFLYNIDAISLNDGTDICIIELSEFVKRPDMSNIPEEKRPLENPLLNLTINRFLQEVRRQAEPMGSEYLQELEREMVVNILRSRMLLPFRPNEDPEDKQVQLLMGKFGENQFIIPIFTDVYEFMKFKGSDEVIQATPIKIDDLFQINIPENTIGFMVNPNSTKLVLNREWLDRVKQNKANID